MLLVSLHCMAQEWWPGSHFPPTKSQAACHDPLRQKRGARSDISEFFPEQNLTMRPAETRWASEGQPEFWVAVINPSQSSLRMVRPEITEPSPKQSDASGPVQAAGQKPKVHRPKPKMATS